MNGMHTLGKVILYHFATPSHLLISSYRFKTVNKTSVDYHFNQLGAYIDE
jgi:hypothetical protein